MHITPRQLFPMVLAILFVGVIVFYAYYQSRAILEGPTITLEQPIEGMLATTSLITVSGFITHAKETTLNGRPVFIDLKGYFSERLLLMDGYNIIELAAKDNEGRVEKKTIELVYREGGR